MKRLLFFITLASLLFVKYSAAQTYASGKPGSARNDTISGHKNWTNLTGIKSSGSYNITSTASLLGQLTNDLIVTGFSFSIPADARITGIEAFVTKSASGLFNDITDSAVRVVVNGVIKGNNLALSSPWAVTDTTIYGSPTQTWGLSWTAAMVDSSTFGLAMSAKMGGLSVLPTATINNVQLRIYYSIPLPVQLVSFQVSPLNQSALLNWVTDLEINNDYFAIERSANADSFEEIGQVAGSGTSAPQHFYAWQDSTPLTGTSYYRLKQVDYNGNVQYSFIEPFVFEAPGPALVNAYPNPVRRGQNLFVETGTTGCGATLDIYDMQGHSLASYPGAGLRVVETARFPSGVLLSLRNPLTGQLRAATVIVADP